MALLAGEIARIKQELGFNVLDVGAEPYIGVSALFDQVIKPYVSGGATTTSSTSVAAASSPTPATIALASAVGLSVGDRVVIDVDALQEVATVRSIAGPSLVVLLSKAHEGTYPVTVEGPESLIRCILQRLAHVADDAIDLAVDTTGIKKVDEIEFFDGGGAQLSSAFRVREYWRDELASALGIERMNRSRGGADAAVY